MNRIPVWFDTDIGVDDSAAFLVLHRQSELEVVGISAVSGNVGLHHTYRNARNICHLVGADYPVYRGADRPLYAKTEHATYVHGEEGLGGARLPDSPAPEQTEAAWDALYRVAQELKGELQVIAVGPLTNIAIALAKYPRLKALIKRLLIMGGGATRGNTTPAAEFNIYADPEAAQLVFKSGIPIVMCGLDVTMRAYLTPEEIHALGGHESAVCRFFRDATAPVLPFYLKANQPGLCLHDVCPVLFLTHPEIFRGQEGGVYVETQGKITYGKTVTDLWSDKKFDDRHVFVVLDLDRPAFAELIGKALLSY